jgi:hypothetical protein
VPVLSIHFIFPESGTLPDPFTFSKLRCMERVPRAREQIIRDIGYRIDSCTLDLRWLRRNVDGADSNSPYLIPHYTCSGQSCGHFHFCSWLDFCRQMDSVYNCTEVSEEGVSKKEPCAKARESECDVDEDYAHTEMEMLKSMKMYDLCGFNEDQA